MHKRSVPKRSIEKECTEESGASCSGAHQQELDESPLIGVHDVQLVVAGNLERIQHVQEPLQKSGDRDEITQDRDGKSGRQEGEGGGRRRDGVRATGLDKPDNTSSSTTFQAHGYVELLGCSA